MSRRIEPGRKTPQAEAAGPTDDYLGRLVKYIPAEIVALYLAAVGVIPKDPNGKPGFRALWIVFLVCLVLVPTYFYFVTRQNRKPTLWWQITLGTIAFFVWVLAIGGPFESLEWYRSWIASLILIFVTFGFGFVKPAPES